MEKKVVFCIRRWNKSYRDLDTLNLTNLLRCIVTSEVKNVFKRDQGAKFIIEFRLMQVDKDNRKRRLKLIPSDFEESMWEEFHQTSLTTTYQREF
jgi:hypothetical protein